MDNVTMTNEDVIVVRHPIRLFRLNVEPISSGRHIEFIGGTFSSHIDHRSLIQNSNDIVLNAIKVNTSEGDPVDDIASTFEIVNSVNIQFITPQSR